MPTVPVDLLRWIIRIPGRSSPPAGAHPAWAASTTIGPAEPCPVAAVPDRASAPTGSSAASTEGRHRLGSSTPRLALMLRDTAPRLACHSAHSVRTKRSGLSSLSRPTPLRIRSPALLRPQANRAPERSPGVDVAEASVIPAQTWQGRACPGADDGSGATGRTARRWIAPGYMCSSMASSSSTGAIAASVMYLPGQAGTACRTCEPNVATCLDHAPPVQLRSACAAMHAHCAALASSSACCETSPM
jgi:hypothetical protein